MNQPTLRGTTYGYEVFAKGEHVGFISTSRTLRPDNYDHRDISPRNYPQREIRPKRTSGCPWY